MGKIRKCRLNEDEIAIHEMAVKLRKKTDQQLVDSFQQIYDQGYSNGLEKSCSQPGKIFADDIAKARFIELLKKAHGIGTKAITKIEELVINECD